MAAVDWIVIAAYLGIALLIGWRYVSRASRSMEEYFLAGRSLPWWVIGFANCASYSGASAAWVMLIFQDGLVGNFWWWPSWVVWMPLVALLWARYWRRMGIVTTAEFIELRYGGPMAKAYRIVYAVYNAFGWAPIVTGYMTGWVVMELKPILGWGKLAIILGCALLVIISTVLSGLLGVAHAQIFQFCFYVAGASCLLPAMLGHFGGWHKAVSAATAARGPDVMKPLPPSASLTPLVVLVLVIQGFFFAANPTAGEGSTAQRFMAAKNETHAALGQMLSAFLALVVRVIPFIVYGIVAVALFPRGSIAPEQMWAELVLKFAPTGLRGLVIAAELAGYMAIANAYMNWGSSFIINDIYKRFLYPDASGRSLATVGRITTFGMTCLSFLVAFFLVNQMMSWFLYINAVMIAFVLPLAWLRFFWWRLNIWGEAAGVLLGLPLGYIIWFQLGFSKRPLWLAFSVLFGAGWIVILLTTLITRPESRETLERFYQRCRPAGYWSPVMSGAGEEVSRRARRELRNDLTNCFVGIVVCSSMVILLNAIVAGSWVTAVGTAMIFVIASTTFIRRWRSTAPDCTRTPGEGVHASS